MDGEVAWGRAGDVCGAEVFVGAADADLRCAGACVTGEALALLVKKRGVYGGGREALASTAASSIEGILYDGAGASGCGGGPCRCAKDDATACSGVAGALALSPGQTLRR